MPRTLRERKIRALKVFKHPAFQRTIPKFKARKEMVSFLVNYLDYSLFNKLPKTNSRTWNVRTFTSGKQSVVLKDTRFDPLHGGIKEGEKHGIREFMKLHHAFVRETYPRKNTKYILRTPQLFGSTKRYLILERIKQWEPKTNAEYRIVQDAKREISTNFVKIVGAKGLMEIKGFMPYPQILDLIPTGIHKGKVVFYVPYDYY